MATDKPHTAGATRQSPRETALDQDLAEAISATFAIRGIDPLDLDTADGPDGYDEPTLQLVGESGTGMLPYVWAGLRYMNEHDLQQQDIGKSIDYRIWVETLRKAGRALDRESGET